MCSFTFFLEVILWFELLIVIVVLCFTSSLHCCCSLLRWLLQELSGSSLWRDVTSPPPFWPQREPPQTLLDSGDWEQMEDRRSQHCKGPADENISYILVYKDDLMMSGFTAIWQSKWHKQILMENFIKGKNNTCNVSNTIYVHFIGFEQNSVLMFRRSLRFN